MILEDEIGTFKGREVGTNSVLEVRYALCFQDFDYDQDGMPHKYQCSKMSQESLMLTIDQVI